MRPQVPCCTPKRIPFPSGLAWAHADSCKRRPGQKVRPGEDHPSRRKGWWTPTPYAGNTAEVVAFKAHTGRWS